MTDIARRNPPHKSAEDLTPREIVAELDKYIVGQDKAKRAVAVALRNRYRRRLLSDEMRDEVIPKNILMIGPTGVGKTEIARRLSRLAGAPFVKVEATKFTEVGYVGRDVDAMVRDITEQAVRMVQQERMDEVAEQADAMAVARLVELLRPTPKPPTPSRPTNLAEAMAGLLGQVSGQQEPEPTTPEEAGTDAARDRAALRARIAAGELDGEMVEIEVEESRFPTVQIFSQAGMEEMGMNLQDMLGGIMPRQRRKRNATVAEAREILRHEFAQSLIDMDQVTRDAVERVEESGIIFIDELDKVAGREAGHGPDVSREGVQRDILPIVEGTTVMTKYGPVRTDHILFMAAGAFHITKPSDLIPELQGRLPLRVELDSLGEDDFVRILTEPRNALTRQYTELLAIEDVHLEFTDDGIREIARIARQVNDQTENIGARRLHTILERLLEEVSFVAPEIRPAKVVINAGYVRERLADVVQNVDLSRYIL
jgi:ATP-dependent HslUV protease ATP-binding subunit HslU